MKRWLILLACCLQGLCLRAAEAMLTHEWRAETSRPAATSVTLRQGETVRLACTLVERAMPVTVPDDASSRFFWKDADADGNAYWSADAELEGNVVSFVWSPDRDAGCRRYAFFLSVESPSQGTIYRAFGLLVMQASPGFDPADLGAPDAFQTVVEAVIGEIDGRYLAEESDPTVPAWAKAPEKPAYTAAEVGAAPESHAHAVSDVDGLTAALDAKQPAGDYLLSGGRTNNLGGSDGDALTLINRSEDGTQRPLIRLASQLDGSAARPDRWVSDIYYNKIIYRMTPGSEPVEYAFDPAAELGLVRRRDLLAYQPAGDYISSETDPTVPAWAKAASKPAYAWGEITGRPATYAPSAHAHAASDISTGTLSYMRLPAAETLRRGAVYPGDGLTVNDLGRLSVIPGDGLTITDDNALAVSPGLYAPASHTHAASDVDGLQAALDAKQPSGDYAHISGDWTEPDEIVIPEHVRLAEICGDKLRLRVTDMSQSELLIVCDYFDDTGAISWSESCNVYQSARVDELLAGHTHSQYLTAEGDPTVPAWAKAASKPAYAWSEISGKPTTWAWSAISGKPSAFTPEAHTHAISGVEGLQTAIDAKAPLSAVSMTEGGTDYVWVWDPNVGTFALTAGGAAPVYPSED